MIKWDYEWMCLTRQGPRRVVKLDSMWRKNPVAFLSWIFMAWRWRSYTSLFPCKHQQAHWASWVLQRFSVWEHRPPGLSVSVSVCLCPFFIPSSLLPARLVGPWKDAASSHCCLTCISDWSGVPRSICLVLLRAFNVVPCHTQLLFSFWYLLGSMNSV